LVDGIKLADPILLEPIMKADITVPESDTGDVMGDLNGRRSRILGMNPNGDGTTTVEAEVPQAEMLRYATELRSQTQGTGSFTMKFDHYEAVPGHLAQRIAAGQQEDSEGKA
jgi:elongation factor G